MIYITLMYVFILLVITYFALFQWRRRHLYRAASKIKGPLQFPLIGNAYIFLCKSEDILMRIYEVVKYYSPGPIRFWLGPQLLIAITEPKHIEKMLPLSKFSKKFQGVYRFPKIFLGEGLITGDGPHIKSDRKALMRMVDLNLINDTMDVLNKHIEVSMNNLEAQVDTGVFDIFHEIHGCAAEYFKEIILGTSGGNLECDTTEFDKAVMAAYEMSFNRMAKPWQHIDFLFNLTPLGKKQAYLRNFVRSQVEAMRKAALKRKQSPTNLSNHVHAVIDSMTDLLDENPEFFTNTRFVDQILTLYVAAEDTTASVSAFFAVCMGMYPEYQEKAAAEVREICGDSPRHVTTEDVTKLKYVSMCIKEVLRLYPIAPILLRECPEDYELDDVMIPKGAALLIPAFNLHRDPRYWERPNSYYPDHFLPEAEVKRPYYSYIPFSAGQRNCLGKLIAKYTVTAIACSLLQRFEFEADGKAETYKIKMDISVRPIDGWRVRIKKRVWEN